MCILCGSESSGLICYNCRKIKNGSKEIGEIVVEKNMYVCRKDYNKHFFFKYHGWGVSSFVLRKLIKINNTAKTNVIRKIRIIVTNEYKPLYVIETELKNFLIHGKKWINDDWDEQYVLHESYFILIKAYNKRFEKFFKTNLTRFYT